MLPENDNLYLFKDLDHKILLLTIRTALSMFNYWFSI